MFMERFMIKIREAIDKGTWNTFKKKILKAYSSKTNIAGSQVCTLE